MGDLTKAQYINKYGIEKWEAESQRRAECRKRYREAHKEQISAYKKRYREAHQEQINEYQRAYRNKNKLFSQILEQDRDFYETNSVFSSFMVNGKCSSRAERLRLFRVLVDYKGGFMQIKPNGQDMSVSSFTTKRGYVVLQITYADQSRCDIKRSIVVYQIEYGYIMHGWTVHHIDLDQTNDYPTNLVAMPISEHNKYHALLKSGNSDSAKEILDKYLVIRPHTECDIA